MSGEGRWSERGVTTPSFLACVNCNFGGKIGLPLLLLLLLLFLLFIAMAFVRWCIFLVLPILFLLLSMLGLSKLGITAATAHICAAATKSKLSFEICTESSQKTYFVDKTQIRIWLSRLNTVLYIPSAVTLCKTRSRVVQ